MEHFNGIFPSTFIPVSFTRTSGEGGTHLCCEGHDRKVADCTSASVTAHDLLASWSGSIYKLNLERVSFAINNVSNVVCVNYVIDIVLGVLHVCV